jgi:hypothetical protein
MSEQRRAERRKIFVGARIVFNKAYASADCIVRNVGDGGARLTIVPGVAVPDTIRLDVPRWEASLSARVIWRDADDVGIVFLSDAQQRDPLELASRFRARKAAISISAAA